MTPQDRTLAREALLAKKLSIEQVTALQKESEGSGRTFAQAAIGRGLLTPDEVAAILGPRPAPVPVLFSRLLIATFVVILLLVVASLIHMAVENRKDRRLAEESIHRNAEADRKAQEAALAYMRQQLADREEEARKALEKARGIMKFAEERFRDAPGEPQLHLQLVEATVQFKAYLERHPEDAAVYAERSRAFELRRDYENALADLDRAIDLDKSLGPGLDARLQGLRLQVARPKR